MTNYISTVNNNKFSAPRPEGMAIKNIVITYTVSPIKEAVTTMFERGTCVHYTINTDGYLNQHHNEDKVAFYAGYSRWHGEKGVNQYAIGIMLENDAKSAFPEAQMTKLVSLIHDIQARHAPTTLEVVGLGEVALDRHIAPGVLFPWAILAESGIGQAVTIPDAIGPEAFGNVCRLNPGDTNDAVSLLQQNLIAQGYGITATGTYDNLTDKAVTVFEGRYNQEHAGSHCWTNADEYILNTLLGLDNSEFAEQARVEL